MHFSYSGTEEAKEYALALMRGLNPELHQQYEDVVANVGGDGTLLEAIRTHHGKGYPIKYFPLNMGTRGYLMNRSMDVDQVIERVERGRTTTHRLPLLSHANFFALNEMAVLPDNDQAAKLKVYVDGYPITTEPVIGGGVIIATGAGSTGFNLAAGGAARIPTDPALSITFVNAYSPRPHPIVVPQNSKVLIQVAESRKRPAKLVVDGKRGKKIIGGEISIRQQGHVEVLYFDDHNFIRRMISKVVR